MRYRRFGRTGWQVSEIGYGMWGMGGWTGSDDEESLQALDRAFALGCNSSTPPGPTARARARQLLGEALRAHPRAPTHRRDEDPAEEHAVAGQGRVPGRRHLPRRSHPRVHREEPARTSACRTIDLQQFHVWSDAWADDDGLAARGRRSEAREAGSRVRHQRQPLGAGQRAARARDRARSTACRWSTTSSTRRRRTSCFPTARRTTSRSSRACRSTKAA